MCTYSLVVLKYLDDDVISWVIFWVFVCLFCVRICFFMSEGNLFFLGFLCLGGEILVILILLVFLGFFFRGIRSDLTKREVLEEKWVVG